MADFRNAHKNLYTIIALLTYKELYLHNVVAWFALLKWNGVIGDVALDLPKIFHRHHIFVPP